MTDSGGIDWLGTADLEYVREADGLKIVSFEKPLFLHNHHRWVLSIIHWAQQQGLLDTPCTVVSLDGHRDWAWYGNFTNVPIRSEILSNGVTHARLSQYLANPVDDNAQWLISGMDFGLIDNAILIGGQLELDEQGPKWNGRDVAGDMENDPCIVVDDCLGGPHELLPLRIYVDIDANGKEYSVLTNALPSETENLRWEMCYGRFAKIRSRQLCLTLDLDFFRADTHPEKRLWRQEDLRGFLNAPVTAESGNVITTGDVIRRALETSAVRAIAREQDWCGGPCNVATALQMASSFLGLPLLL
jgi:hypothetical protein